MGMKNKAVKPSAVRNKKESIGEYDNAETKPIVLLGVSTTDCRWAEYRGGRSSASEESWSYDRVV